MKRTIFYGTIAKKAGNENFDVIILTGDKDYFQLVSDKITIKIPRTKAGKTETEDFTYEKVIETYGVTPDELIEVKGLMGDTSDNIPGVPGIGEKTALTIIQKYKTINNLYKEIELNQDDLKGKTREKIKENKELALLSKELGTIEINVPINKEIEEIKLQEWQTEKVLEIFKKLQFTRYLEKFKTKIEPVGASIARPQNKPQPQLKPEQITNPEQIIEQIKTEKVMYYNIDYTSKIIGIQAKKTYYSKNILDFVSLFEDETILKCGYKIKEDYIFFKNNNINAKNLMFDAEIAAYLLNSSKSKYTLEEISQQYIDLSVEELLEDDISNALQQEQQINLFDSIENIDNNKPYIINTKSAIYAYVIKDLHDILIENLKNTNQLELFKNIEMPLLEILADMQYTGMYVDKQELIKYGDELKQRIEILIKKIYELSGQEFNINSPKQLGEILFEKLNLPTSKKNKTGYSTDVDVLEKLLNTHPIIEKLLEYRQLVKLNSTYVEGLISHIDPSTHRIHSSFNQTVTATGRISSTEPNLQNIPIKIELGKKLRKVFIAENTNILIDADYSQIELRVLAHISGDTEMITAFKNDEDIHSQAAAKVFDVALEDVTKELRSKAKAVNFGIVYGISDFGLSEQLGVSVKQAKEYIEQYLEKYSGIKKFMEDIVITTKEKGYAETLFNRRRYVPEINSTNHIIKQFGKRVAMNTPIQGTAADIIKIAMINIYNELNMKNMKSKLVLQVHDELIIEAVEEEVQDVKVLLKKFMECAINLSVPLKVDLEQGKNWYDAK